MKIASLVTAFLIGLVTGGALAPSGERDVKILETIESIRRGID